MNISQVAAQLYTVRDFCQTPKAVAEAMKKIRALGYRAVQVSGMGPIAEDELLRILDGEGLECCATHEPGDKILNEPEKVAERLAKLRCRYTAYPYPAGIRFDSAEAARDLGRRLSRSGKVLAEAGRVLTYHNHHIEFLRFEDATVLDLIYGAADPKYLQGEIDTHWVQAGGGCPAAWCRKLKARLPLLHLKDYGLNPELKGVITEIGRGNLDWPEIVRAAEDSGCRWFIVEQDNNWANNDPFEALKISYEFIRTHLCLR